MASKENKIKWKKINKIIIVVQLIIFSLFALYLAINIREAISPDEPHHYHVSQKYSESLLLPEDSEETYQFGSISTSNVLYYWINGRILNLNALNINELHLLRIFSVLYSVATLLVTYLLSKEIIKKRQYQTIPMVLLANTLMFQFLSGMMNYDNLVNLFAVLSIYFVVKIFKKPIDTKNISLWIVVSCLGALTKFTMFPLVFIEFLLVLYVLIKKKPKYNFGRKDIWLHIGIAVLFVIPVLLLYGRNVLQYSDITPSCTKVLSEESCMKSPLYVREKNFPSAGIAMFSKEWFGKAFSWETSPLRYFLWWCRIMQQKIYGIMGHKNLYMPYQLHLAYTIFPLSLAFLFLKKWKEKKDIDLYLLIILFFYTCILAFVQNYMTYLNKNGITFGHQGRYIFPVIPIYYILLVKYLSLIKKDTIRKILFIFLLTVFLLGSIPFFFFSVTPDWFV